LLHSRQQTFDDVYDYVNHILYIFTHLRYKTAIRGKTNKALKQRVGAKHIKHWNSDSGQNKWSIETAIRGKTNEALKQRYSFLFLSSLAILLKDTFFRHSYVFFSFEITCLRITLLICYVYYSYLVKRYLCSNTNQWKWGWQFSVI